MLSVLTDVDLVIDDMGGSAIVELRFETADGIDDLVIETERRRCLVQAKRSLSLSAGLDSEYSSVIQQFVRQHVERPEADDRYVLATSVMASKRIRQDLKKLTESVRLNPRAHGGNPVSTSERDVLNTTYALIKHHYGTLSGQVIDAEVADRILGRIVVVALDVEAGGAHERAAIAVVASRSRMAPLIVWQSLVALCLELAKNRQSISAERLTAMMGKYFDDGEDAFDTVEDDELRFDFGDQPLLCGREIVLTDIGDRYVIMEMIRFNEDGSRRVRFVDGNIELDEAQFPVIRRASSTSGMMRLLDADPALLDGRTLVIAGIDSEGDFDGSTWALAHAELCQRLWQMNPAPAVYLDSELFRTYPDLRDFDYSTWFRLRPTGQGFFNSASATWSGPVTALWKMKKHRYAVGSWGVAYDLEDGSRYYLRDRGQVLRFSSARAEETADFMNQAVVEASKRRDPLCVTKDADIFGPYSRVIRMSGRAQPVRVGKAAVVELDRATMSAHRTNDHYYAPLVVLVDRMKDERLTLLGAYVLLTDPLAIADAIANWTAAGFDVPDLATVLVESDDQFDAFVAGAFLDSFGVIVDPRFDMQQNLVSGVVIDRFDSAVASTTASQSPPS